MILRGVAVLSLILLLWNPASSRLLPAGEQPIVLLDASLSMTGAPWRPALDTARSRRQSPRTRARSRRRQGRRGGRGDRW